MEKFNEQVDLKKVEELEEILKNYYSHNGSLQEYLEKLKEEDLAKYYRITEKMAEKELNEQMEKSIISLKKKEVKRNKEVDAPENPGHELYGRFNKFRK
jgi:glutamyl-tRNA reductase